MSFNFHRKSFIILLIKHKRFKYSFAILLPLVGNKRSLFLIYHNKINNNSSNSNNKSNSNNNNHYNHNNLDYRISKSIHNQQQHLYKN